MRLQKRPDVSSRLLHTSWHGCVGVVCVLRFVGNARDKWEFKEQGFRAWISPVVVMADTGTPWGHLFVTACFHHGWTERQRWGKAMGKRTLVLAQFSAAEWQSELSSPTVFCMVVEIAQRDVWDLG